MPRQSRFERDFADLHGVRAMRRAPVSEPPKFRALTTKIDHPAERLAFGAVGLMAALVLIVALFVMGAVAWAMISSLGAPPIS